MKTHKTQVRQDRQHDAKQSTCCCSTTPPHTPSQLQLAVRIAPRVRMHGSNYMTQGQMQLCIAQRTPTWRPDCLPGSAGGQGILSRSATKTPTALARPACRPMGGGGRNIPIKQSLRHCAWCFPVSGAAVQQAGGHGGRTQSEYSESSPSASGFARHCTPPVVGRADPAHNRRRQARLPDASNWRQTA